MDTGLRSGLMTRRGLLCRSGAAALMGALPAGLVRAQEAAREYRLTAAPGRAPLTGEGDTDVWRYNGQVPGPTLRVRQGQRLRVVVENRLAEPTTVHWHGIRLPNAMDGVPNVSQPPIQPGETFTYEFTPPDAGTFWYHPHTRSYEQVGRGLHGALIVEEPDAPAVDREASWVIDDWRLTPEGQIVDDFGDFRDRAHAGRMGNFATVNGQPEGRLAVRAGERLRLRLINVANARIFALDFTGHAPRIIAYDEQPVAPHAPTRGLVLLGPGMRADIVLDMTGRPGERFAVTDRARDGQPFDLGQIVYADAPAVRTGPAGDMPLLPDNPLPEPVLGLAALHEVVFVGGMMRAPAPAIMDGQPTDTVSTMSQGITWAVNGVIATRLDTEPFLNLRSGESYVLGLHNDTAWAHPIHLHGHSFRILSRNGQLAPHQEWVDGLLMFPDERVDVVFVADAAGDWLFHCHILEHAAAGMLGVIRVS